MYTHACVYACTHEFVHAVCMFVCVSVCICACMYVYTVYRQHQYIVPTLPLYDLTTYSIGMYL